MSEIQTDSVSPSALSPSASGNLGTIDKTRTQISEYLSGKYKPTHYSTARVKRTNVGKIGPKTSTSVNRTSTSENTKTRTIK